MYALIGITLLLALGVMAASPLLVARMPALAELDRRLRALRIWIGLAGMVWGLLGLVLLGVGIAGLVHAPLSWLIGLLVAILLVTLGTLFALDISQQVPQAQPVTRRLEPVRAKLVPRQPWMGLGALGAAGLSLAMFVGGGIAGAGEALPPGMEDCRYTTSASGIRMIECPQADAAAEIPEGIEVRNGEILSSAFAYAFMQTDDFAVSLGADRSERDAFYGRGKVGYFKGDRYFQGINLMGEMSLGNTYKDIHGNVFTLEANAAGHLEVRVHKRVILEIRPNGEVFRDGARFGQIANVDFHRRGSILPLMVVAYHRSDLFRA